LNGSCFDGYWADVVDPLPILYHTGYLTIKGYVHSSVGRADCVVIAEKYIYVFEFKLWSAGTAEESLQQILSKGYAAKYQSADKELILVGASFDEKKRNIRDWVARR